jgi:serine/threonine-protein kinase
MTSPADGAQASGTTRGDTPGAEAYCSQCDRTFPTDLVACPHDGARLVMLASGADGLLGKVLDGRYEIRAPLGMGGMGTVYRAQQLSIDREVAIKVIHPALSSDRTAVKRFLREARLASRLSQPNIVNVYDFGQHEDLLYLVMELLRGHTLAAELRADRPMDLKRIAIIGTQLCDALEAAHALDIIHRDLKPGNIVIIEDPAGRDLIKVLDFGLAKSLAQDVDSQVTQPSAILGTPRYMAPEQIQGKPSDQRGDLYALGCILYELIGGAPPFVDPSVATLLARHLGEAPEPLPDHVPIRMRAVVDQLLAKAPEDRFQTAREVRAELACVLEELASDPARAPRRPVPETLPPPSVGSAAPPPVLAPARRRRWLVLAPVAIAVAVVAAIAMRGTGPTQEHATRSDAGARVDARRDAGLAPAPSFVPVDAPAGFDATVDATTARPTRPVRRTTELDAGDEPSVDFYIRGSGSSCENCN